MKYIHKVLFTTERLNLVYEKNGFVARRLLSVPVSGVSIAFNPMRCTVR